MYYYGARYYDPAIGRFTTRDPKKGDLMNPQSLNPYVYCMNNPMKYIDPDGRDHIDPLREMYGITGKNPLSPSDYLFLMGIVAFCANPPVGALITGISKGASLIVDPFIESNSDEAIREWLKKHRDEAIEVRYYLDQPNTYYAKLKNDTWLKITTKEDIIGDWDVESVEKVDNPQGYCESVDDDSDGSFPSMDRRGHDPIPI